MLSANIDHSGAPHVRSFRTNGSGGLHTDSMYPACEGTLVDIETVHMLIDQLNNKIRSPASAETNHCYCLEAPGSPRLQAKGFPGLPGSKNDQFMY